MSDTVSNPNLIPMEGLSPVNPAVEDLGLEGVSEPNSLVRLWQTSKRTGQMALVMVEVLPTNEVIRGGLFAVGEIITRDPRVGALTIGLSTFGLESAGGLAAAGLMNTDKGRQIFSAINKKSKQLHVPVMNGDIEVPLKLSRTTKIGLTFLGGTVVGMALEQRENPNRSVEKNRRYSLFTSAWLAGTVAVAGALAAEGIKIGVDDPKEGALIAGGLVVVACARRGIKQIFGSKQRGDINWHEVDVRTGFTFDLVEDKHRLEKVSEIENDVWKEKGYGSLEEYAKYIAHSRTFAAFEGEECVGLTRMFDGTVNLPPFMNLPFDDTELHQRLAKECKKGEVEEMGTLAIVKKVRNKVVLDHLLRLVYRDARARGVKKWGIIMEPRRVKQLNNIYGFTYKQVGEAVNYQGGECAAHIMDIDEVDKIMKEDNPELYDWFDNQPLGS